MYKCDGTQSVNMCLLDTFISLPIYLFRLCYFYFFKAKNKNKKKNWRKDSVLRMKLSESDTSDEERWWNKKLKKEKEKLSDEK